MNAAMFGMIMPDRKVPNFCTAILALLPAGAVVDALTGFLPMTRMDLTLARTLDHRVTGEDPDRVPAAPSLRGDSRQGARWDCEKRH
jgi:hypothetical protein